ncbi:hypothetical protein DH2020_015567 [Rehmannia glutinosa]|uniref:Uncharacterized protein n=1 Tax=Rehmannia glutinosa TaxID=99300 RepID=A0ABR0WTV5_REHGL
MPTFTAIAFDRLIEPGAAKSMVPVRNSPHPKLERRHSSPNSRQDRGVDAPSSKLERGVSVPPNPKLERGVNIIPSNSKIDRRNGASTTATSVVDRKHHWTQISPALYATPESTPLPDSPSSFPPSPYIINHKRRGPRLLKSFSEDDVATWKQATDEIKVDENGNTDEKDVASVYKDDSCVPMKQDGEVDEFVDPQDSMSVTSIGESEGNGGAERSLNSTTPLAEFYDAWEELSSENGPQLPMPDIESELREMRLSLLMEIEKRKQAEESLYNIRNQWRMIRENLSLVGLTLPVDPTTLPEGEQPADLAAEVCQQVYLARFVSNSIGRGIAKAEVEMEVEAQIKLKNFEIARLCDRLHYYEAVNQEMSQRNQEVVETARRLRQRRKRRHKWVWGSIATAVTLGSAVLAYSYFHSGKGSSSQSRSHTPTVDRDTN